MRLLIDFLLIAVVIYTLYIAYTIGKKSSEEVKKENDKRT